jgi:hypothetical protein
MANAHYRKYLAVPLDKVQDYFTRYNANINPVKYHKGLFKDSIPPFVAENPNMKIAVLRIDGNYYDSYQDAMYYLYPLVPVGGIVIFDDVMTHAVVMRFWLDFKQDYSLQEELIQIDKHSAWFEKSADITIDLSKMRSAQDANLQSI